MVSFMFGCKDIVYCFLRSYEKIGKDFTFCRFFQFREMYEKVSLPVLCRVHAEIVRHIAAEVGWG